MAAQRQHVCGGWWLGWWGWSGVEASQPCWQRDALMLALCLKQEI